MSCRIFFPLGILCKLATASCMQWGKSQLNLQTFIFLLVCYVVEPVLERCLLSVRAAFTVALFSFIFCELGRLPYPPETIRLYLCGGCYSWGLSSKCVKNLASNHNLKTSSVPITSLKRNRCGQFYLLTKHIHKIQSGIPQPTLVHCAFKL